MAGSNLGRPTVFLLKTAGNFCVLYLLILMHFWKKKVRLFYEKLLYKRCSKKTSWQENKYKIVHWSFQLGVTYKIPVIVIESVGCHFLLINLEFSVFWLPKIFQNFYFRCEIKIRTTIFLRVLRARLVKGIAFLRFSIPVFIAFALKKEMENKSLLWAWSEHIFDEKTCNISRVDIYRVIFLRNKYIHYYY